MTNLVVESISDLLIIFIESEVGLLTDKELTQIYEICNDHNITAPKVLSERKSMLILFDEDEEAFVYAKLVLYNLLT